MINRKSILGAVGTAPLLLNLPASEPVKKPKVKSVIYLFMGGGLSQLDSFNIYGINKENLGKSTALNSSADGIQVSNYFANMAKKMHQTCLINTMTTGQGAHPQAIYKMLTSYGMRSSIKHPEFGAWVNKELSTPKDSLPNFVQINQGREATAGFFPGKYAALTVLDPSDGIKYSQTHKTVPVNRFNKRLSLLDRINQDFDEKMADTSTKAYSDIYSNAVKFMKSEDLEAFKIEKEEASIKKLYDMKDKFNQGCLLAGRLVEKGVRFVKVTLGGWDHHDKIYSEFPSKAKSLDTGMAGLLEHLKEKGLFEDTLVVLATEFGRGIKVNVNHGRDHFPKAFSCLLAGGAVHGGKVYGKTSANGGEVLENPVEVTELNASIAHAMGMNLSLIHI